MLNNESNYAEIIDFLEGMTNRQIRDYNTLELLPMNTVMSILNENLEDSIKLWSQSLPNTSISPIRGIGTQTQSIDKQNLRFKVFNIIGFGFSDGSELSICSDGSNGLEIVSFKISNSKKGLGLDKLVFELFLSFCLKSILYIPSILITLKQNHPHYNSVLDFFLKFDFQKIRVEDGIVTLRKKVKYFSSED